MTARWFDKWADRDPEAPCSCGHLLADHPADHFRSCRMCLWCDDFRYRPVPLSYTSAADQLGLNDEADE